MTQDRRLLIVSQDADCRAAVEEIFAGTGYVLANAPTPREAARKTAREEFDLVFVDVRATPAAFELIRTLKQDPVTALLPVLVLGAGEGDRSRAMDTGCADIVLEPLDKDEVLTKTETILELSRNRLVLNERAKLDNVLDAMDDGIVVLERNLRITRLNQKAKTLLGISSVGQYVDFLSCVRKGFEIRYEGFLDTAIVEGPIRFDIERPETEALRPLVLEARTSIVRNWLREVSDIVVVLSDVTEKRRRAFQEEEFLNFISHKLRTPMAIVHKNASLFHSKILGPLNDDQTKFMNVLYEKCCELVDSFEKLLGFTMIRSHKLDLPPERIAADDYLAGKLEATAKRVRSRRVALTVKSESPDLTVNINRKYFDMIVSNLFENAVKFCDKDIAEIAVEARSAGPMVEVSFRDNGPGIPPEDHSRIFDEFYQVDKHRTLNVAGTGLGLAIARYLVTAHGGEIGVKSAAGAGSTFTFTLPAAPPEAG